MILETKTFILLHHILLLRLPTSTEDRLYLSLVHPHLETSAPVRTPHGKETRDKIGKIQRRAVRWICGAKWGRTVHQWCMYHEECRSILKVLLVQERHFLLSRCQVYRIINSLDCIKFSDYFHFNMTRTSCESFCLRVLSSLVSPCNNTSFSLLHHFHGTHVQQKLQTAPLFLSLTRNLGVSYSNRF